MIAAQGKIIALTLILVLLLTGTHQQAYAHSLLTCLLIALLCLLPSESTSSFAAFSWIQPPLNMQQWNRQRKSWAWQTLDYMEHMPNARASQMGVNALFHAIPVTTQCDRNHMERVGSTEDGGKWVCGEYLPQSNDCHIISLGSNGDFSFEEAMDVFMKKRCQVRRFPDSILCLIFVAYSFIHLIVQDLGKHQTNAFIFIHGAWRVEMWKPMAVSSRPGPPF